MEALDGVVNVEDLRIAPASAGRADEKPSIQARARIHEALPPAPGARGQRVEHTYERMGALTYLAALDNGRKGRPASHGEPGVPSERVGSPASTGSSGR